VESIPGGRLTPRLVGLGPGAVVDVTDTAKGGFVLDTSGTTHVMIATGTGIAPFRSMVLDALHRKLQGSFVILHGASYADELPYLGELQALAAANPQVEYEPTVSRPAEARNAGWTGRTGRVDALAEELAAQWAGPGTRVYACGNSGMVDAVTSAMRQRGLKVTSESFD
jgi:ferredoxin--NADP+ reductase